MTAKQEKLGNLKKTMSIAMTPELRARLDDFCGLTSRSAAITYIVERYLDEVERISEDSVQNHSNDQSVVNPGQSFKTFRRLP